MNYAYTIGSLVFDFVGNHLYVTDRFTDCGENVYECNDGNLYYEDNLYDTESGGFDYEYGRTKKCDNGKHGKK